MKTAEINYNIETATITIKILSDEIWNAAIEAAATAMDSIFTEARDTDWDTGYNYCRDNFRNQVRKLKK